MRSLQALANEKGVGAPVRLMTVGAFVHRARIRVGVRLARLAVTLNAARNAPMAWPEHTWTLLGVTSFAFEFRWRPQHIFQRPRLVLMAKRTRPSHRDSAAGAWRTLAGAGTRVASGREKCCGPKRPRVRSSWHVSHANSATAGPDSKSCFVTSLWHSPQLPHLASACNVCGCTGSRMPAGQPRDRWYTSTRPPPAEPLCFGAVAKRAYAERGFRRRRRSTVPWRPCIAASGQHAHEQQGTRVRRHLPASFRWQATHKRLSSIGRRKNCVDCGVAKSSRSRHTRKDVPRQPTPVLPGFATSSRNPRLAALLPRRRQKSKSTARMPPTPASSIPPDSVLAVALDAKVSAVATAAMRRVCPHFVGMDPAKR